MVTGAEALWAQAAAGDHAAFAAFYRGHADAVFTHVWARVDCRADAQDLAAEVFVVAWRKRRSVRFDAASGILPWLLATANNLLRKHYRTQARRSRSVPGQRTTADEPDVLDDLVAVEDDRRVQACLRVALEKLRPEERRVIELRFIRGMSHAAIADLLGVPAATARTRLRRAVEQARRSFFGLYDTDVMSPSFPGVER